MLIGAINTQKNLLAFSAGIDSTALFFLLLEKNIPFDIAIVDYNIRAQSKEEIAYAQILAKKYNKKCYTKSVSLEKTSNFEKIARDIRYQFFEEIIQKHHYETLITAHQLNDTFEWFLMQLSRGAGLVELIGLTEHENRDFYSLCRPMLQITKEELLAYLNAHKIDYFVDESNFDNKHTRNKIRNEFSNEFLLQYKEGVKKSFVYLQEDIKNLNIEYSPIYLEKEFELFEAHNSESLNIRIIDKSLKKRGILLSHAQRNEIQKQKELVISHKIAVSISKNKIWIAPYLTKSMDKLFKEQCRVLKIPKNIRSYLYSISCEVNKLTV